MNYKLVKMYFTTAVHFGEGGLETCRSTLYADTIFSALCVEAVKLSEDKLNRVVTGASEGNFRISDGFPLIGEKVYLPKPLMRIERIENPSENETVSSSVLKKASKKLSFIDAEQFDAYTEGRADILEMGKYFSSHFGSDVLSRKNQKVIDTIDTELFSVRVFRYQEGSGLYFIFGYESDEDLTLLCELMDHLALRGIGGKISSGYGKFRYELAELPDYLLKRIGIKSNRYMSLTTSIPSDEEMDEAMNDADYLLVRRGGYVASETYSDTLRKKRTLYFAAAGAVFSNTFNGKLWNVQTSEGGHAVYKYSLPIFIGV